MNFFKRKPKRHVIGFDVVFSEGGKIYTYQKTPTQFAEKMKEHFLLGKEDPFSVVAIWSDGAHEKVKITKEWKNS